MSFRIGTKVPLNVYDGDRPVCQCHTPEDAARIVTADEQIAALTAELAAAHAERDQLREALALLEWGGGPYSEYCHPCNKWKCEGHAPDCPVGRAMAMGGKR